MTLLRKYLEDDLKGFHEIQTRVRLFENMQKLDKRNIKFN